METPGNLRALSAEAVEGCAVAAHPVSVTELKLCNYI